MKKRSDSELSKKKWRNNSSERDFFFKTFWANSSGGFAGPQTFVGKSSFLSPVSLFTFSVIFPFNLLSSFSSCLFSCLASLFHRLFSCLASSLFFFILSLLFAFLSCVSSSLFFCLLFSCLSSAVFFSLSLCLCLCLRVVLWCVCVCVVVMLWRCGVSIQNPRVSIQNVPVCTFKTCPCVRSKRFCVCRQNERMLKHMCAWCRCTRGSFERTHGHEKNGHTGVFESTHTPQHHTTHQNTHNTRQLTENLLT